MNPNSALIWLPAIEGIGLPVPRTIVVPYDHSVCAGIFDVPDAEDSAFDSFRRTVAEVTAAVDQIGRPAFIRTDLNSAKHSGRRAWLADEEISQSVCDLIEDSEMKFWMAESPSAILVRQFLKLPAPFTAFGGLPISREERIFADSDQIFCAHPYWPADALEESLDPGAPENWRELLDEMHEPPREIADLDCMAKAAAKSCNGGAWSVDFAQDESGKWWLLDMARMENSWHWPGCKFGKGEE